MGEKFCRWARIKMMGGIGAPPGSQAHPWPMLAPYALPVYTTILAILCTTCVITM